MCLRVSRHVCRQAPKSVSRETGMSLSILNPSSNSVPPFLNCGCSYQRMLIYFEGHGWLIHSTSFFFPPFIIFFHHFDEQVVPATHLLSSSSNSLSICPPSFCPFPPCPICSLTFSFCPLATPAVIAMTDRPVQRGEVESLGRGSAADGHLTGPSEIFRHPIMVL